MKQSTTSVVTTTCNTPSTGSGGGGGGGGLKVERKISGNSAASTFKESITEDKSDKGIGSSEIDVEQGIRSEEDIPHRHISGVEQSIRYEQITPKKYSYGELPASAPSNDSILKPRLSQTKRQWSIQAVKGKVTTKCLWNACKALTIGIILIFVGAAMATIGYYAEEANLRRLHNISEAIEANRKIEAALPPVVPTPGKKNKTSKYWRPPQVVPKVVTKVHSVLNVTEGKRSSFGLNKLSYVGPIVMGVGGFVIVAACVMTFEARDSAAKIVPARFRTIPEREYRQDDPGVRHSSAQTKWETLAVYGTELVRFHQEKELSRQAMTSAFIRFSKTIQCSMDSSTEYYDFRGCHRGSLIKCPSAPSLLREFQHDERRSIEAPRILRVSAFPRPPPPRRRLSSNAYPRQTMSVDNPAIKEVYTANYPAFIGEKEDEELELGASATGVHHTSSDASLALDLHLPKCSVTLFVRDNSKSPVGQFENEGSVSPCNPNMETSTSLPFEEIAGPSGINSLQVIPRCKVDKQTSTTDYINFDLGWSRDTNESKDGGFLSTRASAGGSFRENRKKTKKVKRSETIDTTSSAHRKHHRSHHQSRSGSIKGNGDGQKPSTVRSETARRHQLLRQPKIEKVENTELPDDNEKDAHVA